MKTYSDLYVASVQTWVRDADGNILHWQVEYSGGPTQSSDYEYERIG